MDMTQAILDALGQAPAGAGTSLPRLGKRLGLGVSVLMRQLSFMGDAVIGGQPGPGWVRVEHDGERWMAFLTDAGRLQAQALHTAAASPGAPIALAPQAGAVSSPDIPAEGVAR